MASLSFEVYLFGDQVLGRRDEVVEDVLLVLQHPGLVPCLAVLRAAAQVCFAEDAALLDEHDGRGTETGRAVDLEAAVGIEVARILAVELQILAVCDEHRHLRAVLRGVEHLLGGEQRGIEIHRGGLYRASMRRRRCRICRSWRARCSWSANSKAPYRPSRRRNRSPCRWPEVRPRVLVFRRNRTGRPCSAHVRGRWRKDTLRPSRRPPAVSRRFRESRSKPSTGRSGPPSSARSSTRRGWSRNRAGRPGTRRAHSRRRSPAARCGISVRRPFYRALPYPTYPPKPR